MYIFVQVIYSIYALPFMTLWIVRYPNFVVSTSLLSWIHLNAHTLKFKVCNIVSLLSMFHSDNLNNFAHESDKPILCQGFCIIIQHCWALNAPDLEIVINFCFDHKISFTLLNSTTTWTLVFIKLVKRCPNTCLRF